MFLYTVILASLLAQVLSKPAESAPPPSGSAPSGSTPIAIVSQNEEINPDGTFKFSYETANGIKVEENGYLKDDPSSTDKIQVIEGSVSYTDNDGQVISLKYIADENGFQPEGDHLPTPPPLPSAAGVPQGRSLSEQPAGNIPAKAATAAAPPPPPAVPAPAAPAVPVPAAPAVPVPAAEPATSAQPAEVTSAPIAQPTESGTQLP